MTKKVIYYLNQFFGQIGGEDMAHIKPSFQEEAIGAVTAFEKGLTPEAEVAGTIICGDNYFNENKEEALAFLEEVYQKIQPDLVVAGPAFNAGRYGMACAGVAEFFNDKNIPVISGMYEENPGLVPARKVAYVIPTGDSAAAMRKAMPAMIKLANKVLAGETVKYDQDGYFVQGRRITEITEKTGAVRAVEMLMKRLNGEEVESELPMPEFDNVDPAAAIPDLSKATIALVTSGGIVPTGNPDRVQSASAQMWAKYDISGLDELSADKFYSIHGGYDTGYADEDPDRIVPLDMMRKLEKEGYIGKVYDYFYTTTGTGTSVENSAKFGREIGQELKDAGVDGVILTST